MKKFIQLLTAFALLSSMNAASADDRLTLPPGFQIETLAFSVPNARQMALTKGGALIVGTRKAGKVYAVLQPFSESARTGTRRCCWNRFLSGYAVPEPFP